MKTRKTFAAAFSLAACAAFGSGASAATCLELDEATTSYDSFSSCTVVGSRGNNAQDEFSAVKTIVDRLFGDEGVSITASGSFAPRGGQDGNGTGSEFSGDRLADGFDIDPDELGDGVSTIEFLELPESTIFLSIKTGNAFELFRVPAGGTPFFLTNSINDSTSHVSTFAGSVAPIPLPAGGLLLLSGLFGIAAARRARKA